MAYGRRVTTTDEPKKTPRRARLADPTPKDPVTPHPVEPVRNYHPRGICIGAILKWDDGTLEDYDYEHLKDAAEKIRKSAIKEKDDVIIYFWFSKAAGDSATPQTDTALWNKATAEGFSGTNLGEYAKTAYKKRFFKAGPDYVPLADSAGKWIEVSAPDPDNSECGTLPAAT